MYLYGVSGGVARGNLVSGNGSGVYIWDNGGLNFIRVSDISVGASPRSVHSSDLDGDGDIDIVVANEDLNTVSLHPAFSKINQQKHRHNIH